ncbi:MAG: hypothetical protein ACYSR9_15565 [Planctomycetota bacterium]|jgi:hypothetical protein
MKKILTISLVLLVFSSLGCESMKNFFKPKDGEPAAKQPEKFFWDSSHEPIAIAPINTVPAPVGGVPVRADGPVSSDARQLVVLSQSDMAVVSMTYPWPECGIVRLDKTVPREVELNRSFDYFISVTNLTESVLTDILINEELSRGFQFTRSNPAARKDVDKLVWEIYCDKRRAFTWFPIHKIKSGSEKRCG